MRVIVLLIIIMFLSGCAISTVRQQASVEKECRTTCTNGKNCQQVCTTTEKEVQTTVPLNWSLDVGYNTGRGYYGYRNYYRPHYGPRRWY